MRQQLLIAYDALATADEESENDSSLIYWYKPPDSDHQQSALESSSRTEVTTNPSHRYQMIVGVLRSLKQLFPSNASSSDHSSAKHSVNGHETRVFNMRKCRVVDVQTVSGLSLAYFYPLPIEESALLEKFVLNSPSNLVYNHVE
jgi:hypothetical protein